MDADAYVAGKGNGSDIERWGPTNIRIVTPGEWRIENGLPVQGEPKEAFPLPDDIDRLEESAIAAVAQAVNALDAAEQRLANVRTLKADAKTYTDAIRAEYAQKVQAKANLKVV